MSDSSQPCRLLAARLFCPWYSPDKCIGVGFRVFLKGIFPTQRSNPSVLCFLHWQGFTTSSTWEACQVSYYLLEVFAVKKNVYYQGWNRSPAQVGCMRQALRPGALGWPRGSGWRGRWEGGSGWGTHVNPWLFHFNVWQNTLQKKKWFM